jgi:DNA-binding NarL/FixJ family response regulator
MVQHLRLAPASARGDAGSDGRPVLVVLADDHQLMRHSLRKLLDGDVGVRVIAEATDQAQAIRLVQDRRPHVLVLDLRLRGGSSLETVAALREQAPDTRVVVTTMEGSPAFAQRAFEAGAAGFVAKDLADSELLDAVRTAAGGGRYAGPRVAHVLRPLVAAASL